MNDLIDASGKVLVLGAGELGMAVLRALALARDDGEVGPVSVLLRPGSHAVASVRTLGVEIVETDLATASVDALAAVFAPFAQIICCTGFVGGSGTQRTITSAVLQAGVPYYIPWQFGVDYDVVGRGSGQDVWDEQLDVRDMLRAQTATRWTIVSTGMFTSFVFLPAFGLVDLERGEVHALGAWDNRLTVTTPEDIGRLTARIAVEHAGHADQVVYLAGDTFTYSELADTVEQALRRPIQRTLCTVEALKADAAAHPDDTLRKYRVAFARPDGVAWDKQRTFNAERGIPVTDLADWLRGRLDCRDTEA